MSMRIHRFGFTLLEVVIGLILMGSLTASALVALSAQQHSIVLAKQKQKANQIAETLLIDWYELIGYVPTRSQGSIAADGIWFWSTQPVGVRTVCGLPVNIIRLEVMGTVGTKMEPQRLVSLELLQSQNASLSQ
jgi:prepilin-type N-terminal cleavage/methylation domain-containing protein